MERSLGEMLKVRISLLSHGEDAIEAEMLETKQKNRQLGKQVLSSKKSLSAEVSEYR